MTPETHVLVYCGEDESGTPQPELFRCCPLGLQFYSPNDLPSYRVLELQVVVPDEGDRDSGQPVDCLGVVVHSQHDPERDLYRIWVMFADLPEAVRNQFKCLGRNSGFLCPHCENY
jgi:hypothetical protein